MLKKIFSKNFLFYQVMQKVSNEELPKRCRYYSSMIDASTLLTGVDYTNLNETYKFFFNAAANDMKAPLELVLAELKK